MGLVSKTYAQEEDCCKFADSLAYLLIEAEVRADSLENIVDKLALREADLTREEILDELTLINKTWLMLQKAHKDTSASKFPAKKDGSLMYTRFNFSDVNNSNKSYYFVIDWNNTDGETIVYVGEAQYPNEGYPHFFLAFFFNHEIGIGTISRRIFVSEREKISYPIGTKAENLYILARRLKFLQSRIEKSPD